MTSLRRHIRRSEQEWREILSRYEKSDQAQREFCEAEEIALASFLRWRRRLGHVAVSSHASEQRRSASPQSPFVEFLATPAEQTWSIELEFPSGCVLRVRS